MVDFELLKEYGTTRDMIQTVFTAKQGELTPHGEKLLQAQRRKALAVKPRPEGLAEDAAWEPKLSKTDEEGLKWRLIRQLKNTRNAWERRIEGRLREGQIHNFRHHRFYYAADMAWDSSPIHSEILPLNLYAQGKININECVKGLKDCFKGDKKKDFESFVVRDPQKNDDIIGINIPRLHHALVNIVRPLLTRRIAGQVNKYNKQRPYFKYGTRDRKPVSKLRGDVMSQRAEIMTDQSGYRHMFTQAMRKTLLHGHSIVFPESPWDREYEERVTERDPDGSITSHEKVLVSEGINFIMPHPTRIFYDLQHPLSSINTDKGITYMGFWDVQRLRDIAGNKAFYNTDAISISENFVSRFANQTDFTKCWMDGKTMALSPTNAQRIETKNDRTAVYWMDAQVHGDTEVVKTTYYEKVIPKDEGLGEYPYPVWIRLIVVNDNTVIFGEIMPSRPAAYMGYNEDDTRILSQSMAHEIIPYQDHTSNFFSQMLYLMKLESFMILMLDTDIVKDKQQREEIKNIIKGSRYFSNPQLIEWSSSEFREGMNKTPESPLKFVTNNITNQINNMIKAVQQIMSLAERNQIMSQQELGQVASHEISATESSVIAGATDALYGYISEGPDEFRAAIKRLIYESTVAKGSKEIRVPVLNTYPAEVVKAAGFVADESDDPVPPEGEGEEDIALQDLERHQTSAVEGEPYLQTPGQQTLLGERHNLIYDYVFHTRDGSERESNTQTARSLVGLVQMVGKNPAVMQAMGKRQLFEMLTEVFRLAGSPFIFKIPEGADDEIKGPNGQQIEQVIQQMGQQVQMNMQQLQTFGAALQQLVAQLSGQAPLQPLQPAGAGGAAPAIVA